MKNKICAIFGVCTFIMAQSEIAFGQVNIQEIRECKSNCVNGFNLG
jgi:hypothetical protein